jgi:hypothetical protein
VKTTVEAVPEEALGMLLQEIRVDIPASECLVLMYSEAEETSRNKLSMKAVEK